MPRLRDRHKKNHHREEQRPREEIFAVQSDLEEESAIETILTDTEGEEEWGTENRRPKARNPQSHSEGKDGGVLKSRSKRRQVRDSVPWDHHQRHRSERKPVGISEKIERRIAEKEKKRFMGKTSTKHRSAVLYDDDDDESFLPSYAADDDESQTNVTSLTELKEALRRRAKLQKQAEKKRKGKRSKDKKKKKKKDGKSASKRKLTKTRKGGDDDAVDQLIQACTNPEAVYGVACKMVDKAFQLDSSDDDSYSECDDSSDESESETYITAASSTTKGTRASTAITGVSNATSAVPSTTYSGTTRYSGESGYTGATGATDVTGATDYTKETPAPRTRRASSRRRQPVENVRGSRSPPLISTGTRSPVSQSRHPSTPMAIRGKPMTSPSPKSKGMRYRQVIAPPGKLGLSLSSSSQGPKIKMVSRHCPIRVAVGDIIARVNGRDVLRMESNEVMQMFVALQSREKVIDLLPSQPPPQQQHFHFRGPIATPRKNNLRPAGPSMTRAMPGRPSPRVTRSY